MKTALHSPNAFPDFPFPDHSPKNGSGNGVRGMEKKARFAYEDSIPRFSIPRTTNRGMAAPLPTPLQGGWAGVRARAHARRFLRNGKPVKKNRCSKIKQHEMTTRITLPWPPSVNRYYRNVAGKTLISAEGRAYRSAVVNLLAESRTAPPMAGSVGVDIEAFMPDKRRRDLDNLLKGLLDALTHAGLWLDDSQVVDLRIRKAPTIGGMVKVEAWTC